MRYDAEELKKLALREGFTAAGELNLKAVVFMPEVRDMCRADKCSAYGRNWRCPPACGSIEEATERAKKYSFGMLVQTVGKMEDDFDFETIEETSKKHAASFISMMRILKGKYDDILAMGAGTCALQTVYISRRALPLSRRFVFFHGSLRAVGQPRMRVVFSPLQLR